MKLWPLLWSALWRKPAEAVLVCLAVTAAFTLAGLMLGLRTTYQHLIDRTRKDTLYINVRFPEATGLKMPIAMREEIARVPGVAAVSILEPLRGYYQDPHQTATIRIVDHGARYTWSRPMPAAQWDLLEAHRDGVLVSRRMAERLHLKAGDPFPFISPANPRADGSTLWPFQVTAVVPDPDPNAVNGFILANHAYIDAARPPPQQGRVMEYDVAVTDSRLTNDVSVAIDERFANSGTPTFSIPDRAAEENVQRSGISAASVTWPVAGAGIFMILLVTANGIAQSVRERRPELAVLSAVGFPLRTLCLLVVAEALVPCVLGALLGTGLAGLLAGWPAHYLPQDLQRVPAPTVSAGVWAGALAIAVALALAASLPPVLRMRKLAVTEALAGR